MKYFVISSGRSECVTLSGRSEFITLSGRIEFVTLSGPSEFVTLSGPSEFITLSEPSEFITLSGPSEFDVQKTLLRRCLPEGLVQHSLEVSGCVQMWKTSPEQCLLDIWTHPDTSNEFRTNSSRLHLWKSDFRTPSNF